jgi:hypothetical protein
VRRVPCGFASRFTFHSLGACLGTRYRCLKYPYFRIHRGDNTYIEFDNGLVDAYDPVDDALLGSFAEIEFLGETPPQANVIHTGKGPPIHQGVVNWFSPLYGVADGYGNSAEKMILALEKAGRTVYLDPRPQLSSPQTLIKNVMARGSSKTGDVRVTYCPPHLSSWQRKWPNQPIVGFTMWEDDRVPDSWARPMGLVDVVATCSRFCELIFTDFAKTHGISTPIVYVPLGIDHENFPYKRRSWRKGSTFIVLHTSTSMMEPRKGALEAYQAFATAFKGQDDVKLIMRSKICGLAEPEILKDKRVEMRVGVITEEQKRDLINEAHVFLYPSFGEGFGLMPLEAISTGLPSIVARNTSMLDFDGLYYRVECDKEPSRITTPFQKQSLGYWHRPRMNEIVSQLRSVYDNYPKATQFAAVAAKKVRAQWGYEHSAKALIDAFEAVCVFNRPGELSVA